MQNPASLLSKGALYLPAHTAKSLFYFNRRTGDLGLFCLSARIPDITLGRITRLAFFGGHQLLQVLRCVYVLRLCERLSRSLRTFGRGSIEEIVSKPPTAPDSWTTLRLQHVVGYKSHPPTGQAPITSKHSSLGTTPCRQWEAFTTPASRQLQRGRLRTSGNALPCIIAALPRHTRREDSAARPCRQSLRQGLFNEVLGSLSRAECQGLCGSAQEARARRRRGGKLMVIGHGRSNGKHLAFSLRQ